MSDDENVIDLHPKMVSVAICEECGGGYWEVVLNEDMIEDGLYNGFTYGTIQALQCGECDNLILAEGAEEDGD